MGSVKLLPNSLAVEDDQSLLEIDKVAGSQHKVDEEKDIDDVPKQKHHGTIRRGFPSCRRLKEMHHGQWQRPDVIYYPQ